MDVTRHAAASRRVPTNPHHFEAFRASTTDDPSAAMLVKSGMPVQNREHSTLSKALHSADIDVPSSCDASSCVTCRIHMHRRRMKHRDNDLLSQETPHVMLSRVSHGV